MYRRSSKNRGAVFIETVLTLPVLILLVGGAVDFGRWLQLHTAITNSAYQAARLAAGTELFNTTEVKEAIKNKVRVIGRRQMKLADTADPFKTFTITHEANNTVKVVVSTGFNRIFQPFGLGDISATIYAPYLFQSCAAEGPC